MLVFNIPTITCLLLFVSNLVTGLAIYYMQTGEEEQDCLLAVALAFGWSIFGVLFFLII